MPNVLSPRDLVSRPDIMDKTVPHTLKSYVPRTIAVWPPSGARTGIVRCSYDVSTGYGDPMAPLETA